MEPAGFSAPLEPHSPAAATPFLFPAPNTLSTSATASTSDTPDCQFTRRTRAAAGPVLSYGLVAGRAVGVVERLAPRPPAPERVCAPRCASVFELRELAGDAVRRCSAEPLRLPCRANTVRCRSPEPLRPACRACGQLRCLWPTWLQLWHVSVSGCVHSATLWPGWPQRKHPFACAVIVGDEPVREPTGA